VPLLLLDISFLSFSFRHFFPTLFFWSLSLLVLLNPSLCFHRVSQGRGVLCTFFSFLFLSLFSLFAYLQRASDLFSVLIVEGTHSTLTAYSCSHAVLVL
jgi:hypothetical protein